ncbi:MAG: PQQ-dependent sugar dehydrogenase [Candidatus Dormibacteria bacterium]
MTRIAAMVAALTLAGACGGGTAQSRPTPHPSTARPTPTAAAPIASAAAPPPCAAPAGGFPASGQLDAPFVTALAFAPDGRLFLTERGGTIAVFQGGALHTFATVATVTTEPGGGYSERGLLGLALSPTFASDHFVYAFYSLPDYARQQVSRWTDCGGTGQDQRTILVLPSGPDCCHKGGRLMFGPDGMLYVSLGEEHNPPTAQDGADVRGKILRYRPDGSVPQDNPFGSATWAYGLRNVFGMTEGPDGLVATINGPSNDAGTPCGSCGDLLAVIHRGQGYQWPFCWGYGHAIPPHGDCGGQPDPAYSTERTGAFIAPTGITWVDARGPAAYRNHYVFCSLSGGRSAEPQSPHWQVGAGPAQCLYDVTEGPGGALYFSDNTAVHGLPPG